ncbi:MAG: CRISPR-associated endonuclease Cas1 [Lachnospiraceae bacterium]|nr:CRISPR-associated endonuclease Cas1 [Lachnospiraceae bacterium]
MRKLLNTLYITKEDAYLKLDGETIICECNGETLIKIPFDNVENIVCFSYLGCSPALMGKCVSKQVPINFVSPYGKFLAKIYGETKGNVFLRIQQIDKFRENKIKLAQNTIAAKIGNCIQLIKRSMHDKSELRNDEKVLRTIDYLNLAIDKIFKADSIEMILGIEGNCAKEYFSIFNKLFSNNEFVFEHRSKHPPLDPINSVLSYLYTLATMEFSSGLETVGLDSYIGYYHSLRSGRVSLACDLVEEFRSIVERFVITLFNLKIFSDKDFDKQLSGAIFLNDNGRKKMLTHWQEKKRTVFMHPYLKEKIQFGLIPYIQGNLLAKYVRGDIEEYPSLLVK